MSRMAFSALSFFLVIIVPLLSYDEPKVSLIQTAQLVRVLLTGNSIDQLKPQAHKRTLVDVNLRGVITQPRP